MGEKTKNKQATQEGFLSKVKKALIKFFKGLKNFFVKTGRVNGTHCYGIINNIGDFIVYDDHALISAVGMDDVVFTNKNVVSYSFAGLGPIRKNKVTVKYNIVLDNNVIFPEKVRQRNDVNNLTAIVYIDKDRAHFLGKKTVKWMYKGELCKDFCDVYCYQSGLVLVYNLERKSGDKIEHYQDATLYSAEDITFISECVDKAFTVEFNDTKELVLSETAYESVQKIKEDK